MPSGFQQDINQLQPGFYRVVWSANTATYPTGTSTNSGAINPYDWNAFTTAPTTLALSQRLARGNLRWAAILEELGKYSDVQILDVEVTSANNDQADSQPTAISFTARYDRDEFLLEALQGKTDIGGSVIDTVAKAIKHLVVSGITRTSNRSYRVFDPTDSSELQQVVSITTPDLINKIYSDVSVSLIDGTELISKI
jgi:hypothetical protein